MVETKLVDSTDELMICVAVPKEYIGSYTLYQGLRVYKENFVLIPHATRQGIELFLDMAEKAGHRGCYGMNISFEEYKSLQQYFKPLI